MEYFRNSPKGKWVTDPIFPDFQCLDFESCSPLKGWHLQRKKNFLLWCALSFGDDFVFGPSFQPLTYPYASTYKSPREKQGVFDVVPKFSGATEPDMRLVGFIPASPSWCACLMFELCVSWLRASWSFSSGVQESRKDVLGSSALTGLSFL